MSYFVWFCLSRRETGLHGMILNSHFERREKMIKVQIQNEKKRCFAETRQDIRKISAEVSSSSAKEQSGPSNNNNHILFPGK